MEREEPFVSLVQDAEHSDGVPTISSCAMGPPSGFDANGHATTTTKSA